MLLDCKKVVSTLHKEIISKFKPHTIEIMKYTSIGLDIKEIAQLIQYHFPCKIDQQELESFMLYHNIRVYKPNKEEANGKVS